MLLCGEAWGFLCGQPVHTVVTVVPRAEKYEYTPSFPAWKANVTKLWEHASRRGRMVQICDMDDPFEAFFPAGNLSTD